MKVILDVIEGFRMTRDLIDSASEIRSLMLEHLAEVLLVPEALLLEAGGGPGEGLPHLQGEMVKSGEEGAGREHLVVIDPRLLLVPLHPGKQLGDVVLAALLSVFQALGHLQSFSRVVVVVMFLLLVVVVVMFCCWWWWLWWWWWW